MYYIISKFTKDEYIIDIIIVILSFIIGLFTGLFAISFFSFLFGILIMESIILFFTMGKTPYWKGHVRIMANIVGLLAFVITRYIFLYHIGFEHYFYEPLINTNPS